MVRMGKTARCAVTNPLALWGSSCSPGRPRRPRRPSTTPTSQGLRKLRPVLGPRFVGGVVLYDGELGVLFGKALGAVPLRVLWKGREEHEGPGGATRKCRAVGTRMTVQAPALTGPPSAPIVPVTIMSVSS